MGVSEVSPALIKNGPVGLQGYTHHVNKRRPTDLRKPRYPCTCGRERPANWCYPDRQTIGVPAHPASDSASMSTSQSCRTPSSESRAMSKYPRKAAKRHTPEDATHDQGGGLFMIHRGPKSVAVGALAVSLRGLQFGHGRLENAVEVSAGHRRKDWLAGGNHAADQRPGNMNWTDRGRAPIG